MFEIVGCGSRAGLSRRDLPTDLRMNQNQSKNKQGSFFTGNWLHLQTAGTEVKYIFYEQLSLDKSCSRSSGTSSKYSLETVLFAALYYLSSLVHQPCRTTKRAEPSPESPASPRRTSISGVSTTKRTSSRCVSPSGKPSTRGAWRHGRVQLPTVSFVYPTMTVVELPSW